MSNRQVASIYRTIINDVIENVRPDFDEIGIEEAVLLELMRSWEDKVATSRVADFTGDPKMAARAMQFPMAVTASVPSASAASTSGIALPGLAGVAAATAAAAGVASLSSSSTAVLPKKKEKKAKAAKKTGEGEDEIGSDLDDPEELESDVEGDENENGDLIIALYEKVQRVKNRWKVTLKDGLISVGGKEYLFSKCSGEFEW